MQLSERQFRLVSKAVLNFSIVSPWLAMGAFALTDFMRDYGVPEKVGVFLLSLTPYLFGYNWFVRGWLAESVRKD